jgi:hypothetical protein
MINGIREAQHVLMEYAAEVRTWPKRKPEMNARLSCNTITFTYDFINEPGRQ